MSAGFAKCERGYELCSGPTEHLENAHGHAAANDLFPDRGSCVRWRLLRLRQQQPGVQRAAQGSGRPSGPPEPTSVPNVRLGQCTNGIHPIKELHDEALKYFEKQALLHERNVLKLVRTQKEIDRLSSVISAMEQSK